MREKYLSDMDGSPTGEIPDIYYDLFKKYCNKEDWDKYTYASILNEVEDKDYTLTGSLGRDYHEFICGYGTVMVRDENDYYCTFSFYTGDDNKDDIDNSKIYCICFGHLDIGEIRVNNTDGEAYTLENEK